VIELKKLLSLLFVLFLFGSVFAFTIETTIKPNYADKYVNSKAELVEATKDIDMTGFKSWSGDYSVRLFAYVPITTLENGSTPIENYSKALARMTVYKGADWLLDCRASFGQDMSLSEGGTQRCDDDDVDPRKAGAIEIIVERINAPKYVRVSQGTRARCKVIGDSRTVSVDFCIRFRTDKGTGSGGEFTAWVCDEAQLKAVFSGANSSTTQGTGSSTTTIATTTEDGMDVFVIGGGLANEVNNPNSGGAATEDGTVTDIVADSPVIAELGEFIRGVGDCSVSIAKVRGPDDGIKICDSEGNEVNNQISIDLDTSAVCESEQVCLTFWRKDPQGLSLTSNDTSGSGKVEPEEILYFTNLWWLYRIGKHNVLWPFGGSRETAFVSVTEAILNNINIMSYSNWFRHNTHTKCFDSFGELDASISKSNAESFFDHTLGEFGDKIYITVQNLSIAEDGSKAWYISRNSGQLLFQVGNCSGSAPDTPTSTNETPPVSTIGGPEGESGDSSNGNGTSISGDGTSTGDGVTVQTFEGCSPCFSLPSCLACLDYQLTAQTNPQ